MTLWTFRPLFTMSSQAWWVEKIHGVTNALKTNRWHSVDDFLLVLYTSNDPIVSQQAQRNLSYLAGQSFAPEKILNAWLDHGPSGESQDQLHLSITCKAANVTVKETDNTYHQDELHISFLKLNIPYLTTEFGLKKILVLYQTVLPCLWLLLSTILAAQNDYEKQMGREKEGKEEMIPRVSVGMYSSSKAPATYLKTRLLWSLSACYYLCKMGQQMHLNW